MTAAALAALPPGPRTALAFAMPVIVFALLYVVAVRPERAAAARAVTQLETGRAHLAEQRARSEAPQVSPAPSASSVDMPTARGDRTTDVVASIQQIVASPAVGVSNASVRLGPRAGGQTAFAEPGGSTAATVSFNGTFDQVRAFFVHLGGLPMPFEVRSVELERGAGDVMHVQAVLAVF